MFPEGKQPLRPLRGFQHPLRSLCWNQRTKLLPVQWVQGRDPPSSLRPACAQSPLRPSPLLRPLADLSRPPGSATRCPCTPSRTRRAPCTAPREGSEGEGPREGAEGREAALGFGPSPSRLEDGTGSGGGRLSLCHRSNDGRGPRMTPARRCQRLPGKSPAAEGVALAPEPPPPSCPPLSSLVLLHPQDSVRTQRPPHGPPKHGGDAGSYRRSRRRAARRRLGYARETPRRAPPPLREPESQRGCRRELCLQSCRPTPSPAGFCAGACSVRALAGRARKGAGRPSGAELSAGWSDWHLWAQWDHGCSGLC